MSLCENLKPHFFNVTNVLSGLMVLYLSRCQNESSPLDCSQGDWLTLSNFSAHKYKALCML